MKKLMTLAFLMSVGPLVAQENAPQPSDPPSFPELPSMDAPPPALLPEVQSTPSFNLPSASQPAIRQPTPSQADIDAAKAEQDWMVNALKAKKAEASEKQNNDLVRSQMTNTEPGQAMPNNLDPLVELRMNEPEPASTRVPGSFQPFEPTIPIPPSAVTPSGLPAQNPGDPITVNPLTSAPSGPIQPLLGPPRVSDLSTPTQASISGPAAPGSNLRKLSSDPNFIPEGYNDPFALPEAGANTAQTPSPYPQPLPNAAPPMPRPTYRDLRKTIPDPTDLRAF
jgi:hypothetical protein